MTEVTTHQPEDPVLASYRDKVIKDVLLHGLKADPSTCNEPELRFVIQQKTSKTDQWRLSKKELLKYLHLNMDEVDRLDIESIVQEPEKDFDALLEEDEEEEDENHSDEGHGHSVHSENNHNETSTLPASTPAESGNKKEKGFFATLFKSKDKVEKSQEDKDNKENKDKKDKDNAATATDDKNKQTNSASTPETENSTPKTLQERLEIICNKIDKLESTYKSEMSALQAEVVEIKKMMPGASLSSDDSSVKMGGSEGSSK